MVLSRRQIFKLSGAIGASFLSGCVTDAMLSVKKYTENITSVLVTEDKKKLVVATENYHYIFDAKPDLLLALEEPVHQYVSASFSFLWVDTDNGIDLHYWLTIGSERPDEIVQRALQSGFKPNSSNVLVSKGEMEGVRYLSGGIELPAEQTVLNRQYEIEVRVEDQPGVRTAKTLLTPVTVTIDGLVVLGSIALVPVLMLLYPFWRPKYNVPREQ